MTTPVLTDWGLAVQGDRRMSENIATVIICHDWIGIATEVIESSDPGSLRHQAAIALRHQAKVNLETAAENLKFSIHP